MLTSKNTNKSNTFKIIIQELNRPDTVYNLTVNWWTTVKNIKDQLKAVTGAFPSKQQLLHPSDPTVLKNTLTLHDIGLDHDGSMLRVVIDHGSLANFILSAPDNVVLDEICQQMFNDVQRGLERNRVPAKSDIFDGTSGVYFMRSITGAYISVFKPRDEEQGMPNNPKDHVDIGDASLREDFSPGEGCFREQAAYIMDVENFSRVPQTILVHCEHSVFNYQTIHGKKDMKPFPKYGSMQLYVRSEDSFENFGMNFFSDIEVQRIALLDIRLLNCDRNSANILVRRAVNNNNSHPNSFNNINNNQDMHFKFDDNEIDWLESENESPSRSSDYELIPIDHGYCLPPKLHINSWDWTWYEYDQVTHPVHPLIKEYIQRLDINKIVDDLKKQTVLSNDCYFLVQVSHYLLVEGIHAGLTLKDIADIIVRGDDDLPSKLELLIQQATENAHNEMNHIKDTNRDIFMIPSLNTVIETCEENDIDATSSHGSIDKCDIDCSGVTTAESSTNVSPITYHSYHHLNGTPLRSIQSVDISLNSINSSNSLSNDLPIIKTNTNIMNSPISKCHTQSSYISDNSNSNYHPLPPKLQTVHSFNNLNLNNHEIFNNKSNLNNNNSNNNNSNNPNCNSNSYYDSIEPSSISTSNNNNSSYSGGNPLSRSISFQGIESYSSVTTDNKITTRNFTKKLKDKKMIENSDRFQQARLNFAKINITHLIKLLKQ